MLSCWKSIQQRNCRMIHFTHISQALPYLVLEIICNCIQANFKITVGPAMAYIFLSNFFCLPTIAAIFLFSPLEKRFFFYDSNCLVWLDEFLTALVNPDSFSSRFSKSNNSSSSFIISDDSFCLFLDTVRSYNKSHNIQSFDLCNS